MKKLTIIFLCFLLLAGISSCVKEKYSAPPATNSDPNLTPNTTIAGLVDSLGTANYVQVTSSLILKAVVVGDDKSGNLYKQLAIEDSTGGIMLIINGSDLYATYPVGRRLFISLQGLYIANYEGTYEIVGSVDNGTYTGIGTPNLSQYITPGKWGIYVAPKAISVTQLMGNLNGYQSELVELNSVEFITGNRGINYANATFLLSSTLDIKDCNENQVAVYTSGYADFANSLTPTGNGTMICIAGVYDGAAQVIIRDTTDLNMTGPICP